MRKIGILLIAFIALLLYSSVHNVYATSVAVSYGYAYQNTLGSLYVGYTLDNSYDNMELWLDSDNGHTQYCLGYTNWLGIENCEWPAPQGSNGYMLGQFLYCGNGLSYASFNDFLNQLPAGSYHIEMDVGANQYVSNSFTYYTSPAPIVASPEGQDGNLPIASGLWINTPTVTLTVGGPVQKIAYAFDADTNPYAVYHYFGSSGQVTMPEGIHTLFYYGLDASNNVVTQIYLSRYYVDTTVPVITASPSGGSGWTNSNTVTLTATNGISGVNYITYWITDTSNPSLSVPTTTVDNTQSPGQQTVTVTLPDGTCVLHYYCTDCAGTESVWHSDNYEIDTTPPVTTASPAGGSGWTNSNTVTLTASDTASGVKTISYSVDGGSTQVVNGASTTIPLSDGSHTIIYWSVDNEGNIETHHTGQYNVDTVAPVTTATPSGTMGANGWYTSNVQVTLSATDLTSGVAARYYALDNGGQQAYYNPLTITQGTHTLTYWSVDNAGNMETSKTLNLQVDTTAPSISWSGNVSPNANNWYNQDVLVHFTPSVGPSGVSSITPDQTITATQGAIAGKVTDGAGRTASVTTGVFNIDKTPPTISGKASAQPNANNWYNGNVMVNFTASDSLSGVQLITGNTTLTGEGAGQSVTGTATDYAGNTASATVAGINIDESAPVVTLTITPGTVPSGWYVSDVVVNITATDAISGVDGISYDLDGHGWMPYSSNLTLTDGKHTLQYQAVDKAGNAAVYTKTIDVDTSSPVSTVNLAGAVGTNGWYTSNLTVMIVPTTGASGLDHSEYSFDGVNWMRGSSYNIVTEGVNTSYYRSVNGAGNVEAYKTLVVKMDRSLPTISCTLSGNMDSEGWYSSDVSITLATSDAISGVNRTEYSTNDLIWNKYNGAFIIPLGSRLTVYYRTIDNASNTAGGSTLIYFPPESINMLGTITGLLSLGQPTVTPTITPSITPQTTAGSSAGSSSPSTTPATGGASTATATPSGSPQGNSGTIIYLVAFGIIVVATAGTYFLFTRK